VAKAKAKAAVKHGAKSKSSGGAGSKARAGARKAGTGKRTSGKRTTGKATSKKTTSRKTAGLKTTGKATMSKSAAGTRPVAARRPSPRKAEAQLPGEKAVSDTDRAFPVKPERVAPGESEPMPDAAIDRRLQVVGTDDPVDVDDPSDGPKLPPVRTMRL
jgi:hypothetical protein